MMSRLLLTLLLAASLSGCGLIGDRFHTPDTALPDQWSEIGSKSLEQCTAWPDQEWWKQFDAVQLTALIDEARVANFDINAAVARVRQADAQARIAGAALLPTIDANAGANRTRSPGGSVRTTGITTTSGGARIANAYNASLNASYEIDFWGKNTAAEQSALALALSTRYDQETVTLTVVSDVATTYFNILGLQSRIAVANNNIANASEVMNALQKRFDNGLATALDTSQQENVLATQQATLPPLELQLRQNVNALAILLGKMPETLSLPQPNVKELNAIALPEIAPGLPSELLERRPDVQFAEAQLIAANADITVARANFFPSIGLTAQGGYESNALSALFKPETLLWSLGSSLTQPIFHGGALEGNLLYAHARYDELVQNYRKTAISAFSDVENALAAVKQNAAEEQAQQVVERTASQALTLAQTQFSGGVIDITTLLNTQRTLFAAEDSLIQARLPHLQAIVGLYKALGGGWQKPNG